MPTMEDIAQKLNVTKGTVSKALNGAPDISETLRKTILETAVEMGYTRTMRKSEHKHLCIFIENMRWDEASGFGYGLVLGFRKMAEPAGYAVDIVELDRTMEREMRYDEYMLKHNYAGAAFFGLTLLDEWLAELGTSRTPAVLLDNHVQCNPHTATVGVDNGDGMELAVSYLKGLGHRKIGYLSSTLGSYVYQVRFDAFWSAMRRAGLPRDRALTGFSLHTAECTHKYLPTLLEKGATAIVCSHDELASSVMLYCQELGLRVPEQLSVIGFDDLPICAYTAPPLTTVRQDREELGRSAYYALNSLISGTPVSTFLLHPTLVVRGSVAEAHEKNNAENKKQICA